LPGSEKSPVSDRDMPIFSGAWDDAEELGFAEELQATSTAVAARAANSAREREA
jgi:hypothetical protein